jgi:hypothetical protein
VNDDLVDGLAIGQELAENEEFAPQLVKELPSGQCHEMNIRATNVELFCLNLVYKEVYHHSSLTTKSSRKGEEVSCNYSMGSTDDLCEF